MHSGTCLVKVHVLTTTQDRWKTLNCIRNLLSAKGYICQVQKSQREHFFHKWKRPGGLLARLWSGLINYIVIQGLSLCPSSASLWMVSWYGFILAGAPNDVRVKGKGRSVQIPRKRLKFGSPFTIFTSHTYCTHMCTEISQRMKKRKACLFYNWIFCRPWTGSRLQNVTCQATL